MNMQVHDGLSRSGAVRLDDVQAIWMHRLPHRMGGQNCDNGQPRRKNVVELPDRRNVATRDDESVPQTCGLKREEGDNVLVAIHLAGVGIGS